MEVDDLGGWEGGLLKTKAAEEIKPENDGVSVTWKQGVLLLKMRLNKSKKHLEKRKKQRWMTNTYSR